MGLFSAVSALILVALPFPALAGTAFYGPDAPCMQWMTHGNFLIANCPGPEITAMTVLDLNQCYAAGPDGNLVAANHGNFNTKGNCTFLPVENGSHDMATTCPDSAKPGSNTTSLVNLGKSQFSHPSSHGGPDPVSNHVLHMTRVLTSAVLPAAHVENRNSVLWCGSISSCYIDGPGCLGCQDTWIKDGIRCARIGPSQRMMIAGVWEPLLPGFGA